MKKAEISKKQNLDLANNHCELNVNGIGLNSSSAASAIFPRLVNNEGDPDHLTPRGVRKIEYQRSGTFSREPELVKSDINNSDRSNNGCILMSISNCDHLNGKNAVFSVDEKVKVISDTTMPETKKPEVILKIVEEIPLSSVSPPKQHVLLSSSAPTNPDANVSSLSNVALKVIPSLVEAQPIDQCTYSGLKDKTIRLSSSAQPQRPNFIFSRSPSGVTQKYFNDNSFSAQRLGKKRVSLTSAPIPKSEPSAPRNANIQLSTTSNVAPKIETGTSVSSRFTRPEIRVQSPKVTRRIKNGNEKQARMYPRHNGWTMPPHPFQLIAAFFLTYFGIVIYGTLCSSFPNPWNILLYTVLTVLYVVILASMFWAMTKDPVDHSVREEISLTESSDNSHNNSRQNGSGRHLDPTTNQIDRRFKKGTTLSPLTNNSSTSNGNIAKLGVANSNESNSSNSKRDNAIVRDKRSQARLSRRLFHKMAAVLGIEPDKKKKIKVPRMVPTLDRNLYPHAITKSPVRQMTNHLTPTRTNHMPLFQVPATSNHVASPWMETTNAANKTVGENGSAYYCHLCEVFVSPSSKHCRQCNKCIVGFDHHCRWLNNCVGRRNYTPFAICILSSLIAAFLIFCASMTLVSLYIYVNYHNMHQSEMDTMINQINVSEDGRVKIKNPVLEDCLTLFGRGFLFEKLSKVDNNGRNENDYNVSTSASRIGRGFRRMLFHSLNATSDKGPSNISGYSGQRDHDTYDDEGKNGANGLTYILRKIDDKIFRIDRFHNYDSNISRGSFSSSISDISVRRRVLENDVSTPVITQKPTLQNTKIFKRDNQDMAIPMRNITLPNNASPKLTRVLTSSFLNFYLDGNRYIEKCEPYLTSKSRVLNNYEDSSHSFMSTERIKNIGLHASPPKFSKFFTHPMGVRGWIGLIVITLLFSLIATLILGHLASFHVYIKIKGITTYDYIKRKERERSDQNDGNNIGSYNNYDNVAQMRVNNGPYTATRNDKHVHSGINILQDIANLKNDPNEAKAGAGKFKNQHSIGNENSGQTQGDTDTYKKVTETVDVERKVGDSKNENPLDKSFKNDDNDIVPSRGDTSQSKNLVEIGKNDNDANAYGRLDSKLIVTSDDYSKVRRKSEPQDSYFYFFDENPLMKELQEKKVKGTGGMEGMIEDEVSVGKPGSRKASYYFYEENPLMKELDVKKAEKEMRLKREASLKEKSSSADQKIIIKSSPVRDGLFRLAKPSIKIKTARKKRATKFFEKESQNSASAKTGISGNGKDTARWTEKVYDLSNLPENFASYYFFDGSPLMQELEEHNQRLDPTSAQSSIRSSNNGKSKAKALTATNDKIVCEKEDPREKEHDYYFFDNSPLMKELQVINKIKSNERSRNSSVTNVNEMPVIVKKGWQNITSFSDMPNIDGVKGNAMTAGALKNKDSTEEKVKHDIVNGSDNVPKQQESIPEYFGESYFFEGGKRESYDLSGLPISSLIALHGDRANGLPISENSKSPLPLAPPLTNENQIPSENRGEIESRGDEVTDNYQQVQNNITSLKELANVEHGSAKLEDELREGFLERPRSPASTVNGKKYSWPRLLDHHANFNFNNNNSNLNGQHPQHLRPDLFVDKHYADRRISPYSIVWGMLRAKRKFAKRMNDKVEPIGKDDNRDAIDSNDNVKRTTIYTLPSYSVLSNSKIFPANV
ncbi:unnamed protein product [Gordionus sp. m RMFG-2023]|uniref:uncharacterized protein LOC135923359 n=1 Tax=Gordionus sp. m RMFG-2023 TaxID=3053472 RepID=UPI0030E3D505